MFEENIIETEVYSNIVETESDSLIGTPGIDGVTFTPSVSQEGIISWTNNGGLPNPEPINIKGDKGDKGDKGEKGEPGNVSLDTINSIEVVDTLPDVEENGVLYLVKDEIKYVTYPAMEMGDISRDGTLSDSTSYCRTADYVYVNGKTSIKLVNGTGTNTRVLLYDKNKNIMTGWNTDSSDNTYSYKHVADGDRMSIPWEAYYMKARFSSSEVKPLTITYYREL